jgi:hypothetical protein
MQARVNVKTKRGISKIIKNLLLLFFLVADFNSNLVLCDIKPIIDNKFKINGMIK